MVSFGAPAALPPGNRRPIGRQENRKENTTEVYISVVVKVTMGKVFLSILFVTIIIPSINASYATQTGKHEFYIQQSYLLLKAFYLHVHFKYF